MTPKKKAYQVDAMDIFAVLILLVALSIVIAIGPAILLFAIFPILGGSVIFAARQKHVSTVIEQYRSWSDPDK
tara:strand:+ start:2466 stop:2684 length:219 start_codon:yes stop_codon:yes gene_type:complete